MLFNIIFLLALGVRTLAFTSYLNGQQNDQNQVVVVDFNAMGQGVCPNIKKPLCATNGKEFLYFDNQCQLEAKNYKQLLQGLQEFHECPLSYCGAECTPCAYVYEPVCAIDLETQQKVTFPNPCEVERITCTTQKVFSIIASGPCSKNPFDEIECPQACNLLYEPVCAQYQNEIMEFPNECVLRKEICETYKEWTILRNGSCSQTDENTALRTTANCPKFCTKEYIPVCAQLNGVLKEFANDCELQTALCGNHEDWQVVNPGPCLLTSDAETTNCPKFCTKEYIPVCAQLNGVLKEFANDCELQAAICHKQEDWQVVNPGPCLLTSDPETTNCPKFCTLEYSPICAQLNGELREFGNKCELEVTICRNYENWQIINEGPCLPTNDTETSSCPKFCTKEYIPVCAKFNNEFREFSNKCVLLKTICETYQKWEVVDSEYCSTDCPKICTKEFDPVCAEFNNELKQFPNKCVMKAQNCELGQNWKIVFNGTCLSYEKYKKPTCPQFCTKEYIPVCAKFNNEFREFSNKCELLKTICETYQKWEVVDSEYCSTDCPKFCTKEFKPVCAEFNNVLQQFPNKCVMKAKSCELGQNWKIVFNGTCLTYEKHKKPTCPQFCTKEYIPVCAKFNNEFREFSNKCELLKTICETYQKWEVVDSEYCSTDCPKFCTKEFKPVCAEFNNVLQQFPNKCVMKAKSCELGQNWKIVFNGTCLTYEKHKKPTCPQFCTKEYIPVCAKFNNEFREFSNKCELLKTICETYQKWEVVDSEYCSTDCPKFCTEKFDPVCAEFNNKLQQFPNECVMKVQNCELGQNWKIIFNGTCLSDEKHKKPTCPQSCTLEYSPICAQLNGELREFGNKCELEVTICQNYENWQVVNQGPCLPTNDTETNNCPKFCTKEYIPVCAKFNNEFREFSNKCVLLKTICETYQKWEVVDSEYCSTDCPKICTKEFDPVCAEFNNELKQFPNKCVMKAQNCELGQNWKIVFNGTCLSYEKHKKPTCPQFCTKEYIPVCAKFNNEFREFSNKCELLKTICETYQKWEVVDSEYCSTDCPKFCTEKFDPVCAEFNNKLQQFPNECVMKAQNCELGQNWKIIFNGTCLSDEKHKKPTCPQSCTLEYSPICAQLNGELREFGNKCELEVTICQNYENWQIVNEGPCLPTNDTETSNCPKFCTKEYIPVCAKFNNEFREFSNKCELLKTICETYQKWEVVDSEYCSTDCPKFCTKEFDPVCAEFNNELQQFPNKCVMKAQNCELGQNWKIVNTGVCPPNSYTELITPPTTCTSFCSAEPAPVCAQFEMVLKQFDNICQLEKDICETGTKWQVVGLHHCAHLKNCPEFCTDKIDPVCGERHLQVQEFKNDCEVLKTFCETGQFWEIVNSGHCSDTCPVFCSKEPDPVCAALNSEIREFRNKCELNKAKCISNQNWQIIKKGSCAPYKNCPKFCTLEYKPVCAKLNGEFREFGNACAFQKTNCESNMKYEFVKDGPCPNCPKACTDELMPICARFEIIISEFPNKCVLQQSICETNIPWEIVHFGSCFTNSGNALGPVSATSGTDIKMFKSLLELKQEIKDTRMAWSPRHGDKRTKPAVLSKEITKKTEATYLDKNGYGGSTEMTTTKYKTQRPYVKYYSKTSTTTTTPKTTTKYITTTKSSTTTATTPTTTTTEKPYKIKYTTRSPYTKTSTTTTTPKTTTKYITTTKSSTTTATTPTTTTTTTTTEKPYKIKYTTRSPYGYEVTKANTTSTTLPTTKTTPTTTTATNYKTYKTTKYPTTSTSKPKTTTAKTTTTTKHSYYFEKSAEDYSDSYSKEHIDCCNSESIETSDLYSDESFESDEEEREEAYKYQQIQQQNNTSAFSQSSGNYKKNNFYSRKDYNNKFTGIKNHEESANFSTQNSRNPANVQRTSKDNMAQPLNAHKEERNYLSNYKTSFSILQNKFSNIPKSLESIDSSEENHSGFQNQPKLPNISKENVKDEIAYEKKQPLYSQVRHNPLYSSVLREENKPNGNQNPQVFEIFMADSDVGEDDIELVNKVLTNLAKETSSESNSFKLHESEINHTKGKQDPATSKKGEIYNGAVYKAPVYDSPTYNFIYATPNHPIYHFLAQNKQFPNYAGNSKNLQNTDQKSTENVAGLHVSSNPSQFLTSLTAITNLPPNNAMSTITLNHNIQPQQMFSPSITNRNLMKIFPGINNQNNGNLRNLHSKTQAAPLQTPVQTSVPTSEHTNFMISPFSQPFSKPTTNEQLITQDPAFNSTVFNNMWEALKKLP